jgi:hypothetical protein
MAVRLSRRGVRLRPEILGVHRRLRRDGPQASGASLVSAGKAEAVFGDDPDRWLEVKRLRNEHPDWVIIWLATTGQFRAYRL